MVIVMLSSMNNRMNLVAGPFRDGTWLVATASVDRAVYTTV